MFFMPLKVFLQRRIARAAVGLLALTAAAFAQYKLANVPRPVDLNTIENFSPAIVRIGQEELVIEGPLVNSTEGMLFSHDGKQNETVDVNFDRARLDGKTISMFEDFGLSPPSTSANFDYQAHEPKKPPTGDEPCRTRVELRTASQMPAEIHLFQIGDSGLERYRLLEMTTRGADLISSLMTTTPGESDLAPGCQKLLKMGDWRQVLPIMDITAIAAQDTILRFKFMPMKTNTNLWGDAAGFYAPFDLGSPQLNSTDPPAFRARGVSIRSLGGDAPNTARPTLASVQSTSEGPLLTISGLQIGSDQLKLNVTGKGWVKINGVDKTVNIRSQLAENPTFAGLLTAFNAALLAWVARMIFKRPSKSPQPSGPQEKGRSRRLLRRHKVRRRKSADD